MGESQTADAWDQRATRILDHRYGNPMEYPTTQVTVQTEIEMFQGM